MKVKIVNLTDFNQFVDIDGDKNTDDVIIVGPKEVITSIEIPNEARLTALTTEFNKLLSIRKI